MTMHIMSLDGLLSTSCGGLMSSIMGVDGDGVEEGVSGRFFADWRFTRS